MGAAGATRGGGGGGGACPGLLPGAGGGEGGGDVGRLASELGEDAFVAEDVLLSPALVLRQGLGDFRHFRGFGTGRPRGASDE